MLARSGVQGQKSCDIFFVRRCLFSTRVGKLRTPDQWLDLKNINISTAKWPWLHCKVLISWLNSCLGPSIKIQLDTYICSSWCSLVGLASGLTMRFRQRSTQVWIPACGSWTKDGGGTIYQSLVSGSGSPGGWGIHLFKLTVNPGLDSGLRFMNKRGRRDYIPEFGVRLW